VEGIRAGPTAAPGQRAVQLDGVMRPVYSEV
jgi:hypothetical protein